MKAWTWLAAGSGAYLVALAMLAPAGLLDTFLDDASAGRIRLVSAEGTVWSGRALAELRDDADASRWATPLAWTLQPASLLSGRLDYRLDTGPSASVSSMSVSRSRVELAGVDIRLSAATLAAGIPAVARWGVGGEVRIVADRLGFGPAHASGRVAMQWHSAGSALSPVSPLGDYALDLEGRDQQWFARLRTLAGPLQLDGSGEWRPGEPPAFAASALASPAIRAQLAPFLRLVATERSDGHFEWRLP